MKVLYFNLFLLKFLGLYTDETNIRVLQTIRFVLFLAGVTFSASVCSGIYLYYHYRELEMATNALIVLTAGMAGSTSFITFGMSLKEIKEIFLTLQPMVNTGENLNNLKKKKMSRWNWVELSFVYISCGRPSQLLEAIPFIFTKKLNAKVAVIPNG